MQIDSNIPMPESISRPYSENAKVVTNLKIGDSIFFKGLKTRDSQINSIRAAGRYHGIKVMTRKVEGGTRLWRVE